MSKIVYLDSTQINGKLAYKIAPRNTAANQLNLTKVAFSETSQLRKLFGGSPVALTIMYQTSDRGVRSLHYHPGSGISRYEHIGWELAGALAKAGAAIAAVVDSRRSNRRIPPSVALTATNNGMTSEHTISNLFDYISNERNFASEGYYYDDGISDGLFIVGKITPHDIYNS